MKLKYILIVYYYKLTYLQDINMKNRIIILIIKELNKKIIVLYNINVMQNKKKNIY